MGRMGEQMIEQEQIDLIWAAGFIDGEGCISLIGDRGIYTAMISAGQVNEQPLRELQNILGGPVGPAKDDYGSHWQWRLYGVAAANACERLLPYLRNKNKQAVLLIAYQSLKGSRGIVVSEANREQRELLFKEVKALNARRSKDAERLSEEAPQLIEDDAIVRAHTNIKCETEAEMTLACS